MRKFRDSSLIFLGLLATACCTRYETQIEDQEYIHKYGVTVPKYHWEEAGQNGQVVTRLRNGITCRQTFYCGVLEGDTCYTFPDSDATERVEVYSQDKKIKETFYYLNGSPRKQIVYNPQEHTVIMEWYENGSLKSIEKWAGSLLAYAEYYDNQQKLISGIENGSGIRMMRDTDGVLLSTQNLDNGKIEYHTTYYPDGAVKEVTPYKKGVEHGLRRTYYSTGEPKTLETWKNGHQDGYTTIFVDGEKAQDVPYVNGVKNGIGRIYKDGATVTQEITWKDDMLHGPSRTFIGDRVATEWYYKGNKVTKGYYDSFQTKPLDIPYMEPIGAEQQKAPGKA